MSDIKLSPAQKRVMDMMSHGWPASKHSGMSVYINGLRQCNVDTMTVLERLGLIERESRWTWKATKKGREMAK